MNLAVTKAKAAAKQLRARLSDLQVSISHSQSLEAAAAALSGLDWNRYLAIARRHQELAPPVPLLLARPGEGGWMALRAQDLVRLMDNPGATAVWCFADTLAEDIFANPEGVHVLRTWAQMKSLSPKQSRELADQCRGKILLIHATPNFGTMEEGLSAAKTIHATLLGQPVLSQALEVSWLDIHRWIRAPGAADFLSTLRKSGLRLRFQSQIEEDLRLLSEHFPLRILLANPHARQRLLKCLLEANQDAASTGYPMEVVLQSHDMPMSDALLSTLDGCVSWSAQGLRAAGKRSSMKPSNPYRERLDHYLREELAIYQERAGSPA